ncbi:hypothetical protein RESH_02928 [Rhodopirellula europaea SH398]|uniref:Uncharacterized protein n=1 Tax=Rhodopirellula europaea SH398 TaxID=1263868 RepID=M5S475_9BACT|nr:hypothetical protein RESH_02928 [Rhodopirellula europaea SH398]
MKGNGSQSRIRGLCRLSFSRALRKVRIDWPGAWFAMASRLVGPGGLQTAK